MWKETAVACLKVVTNTLQGLGKITENFSQEKRPSGSDSNPRHPECKVRALCTKEKLSSQRVRPVNKVQTGPWFGFSVSVRER
jgi:hypothetical protein